MAKHCPGELGLRGEMGGGIELAALLQRRAMSSSEMGSRDAKAYFLKQHPHSSQVCIPYRLSHVLVSSYTLSLSCEASVVRDAGDTAVAALPSGTRTLGLGGK